MRIQFNQTGTFQAMYAAEKWCRENGFSVGHTSRDKKRCLLHGDYDIAKWHNLTPKERSACHGVMSGDMREGPVFIDILDSIITERNINVVS